MFLVFITKRKDFNFQQTLLFKPSDVRLEGSLWRFHINWPQIHRNFVINSVILAALLITCPKHALSQPHFEASVRMRLTLPKVGTWSPPRLPQLQSSITEVKTPRLEVFFIPLKRTWSVDVENGLAWAIQTFATQVMVKRRAGSQFDSRPLKVGKRSDLGVRRWSAKHCWKALEESYKFALDLIPIQGLSWELWTPKVPGVQTGTVSGLLLGSPRNKSHLDVGAVEQRREYYMGEGGGFPRVRAVVSPVS
jgi:hypothetical protein